MELGRSAVSTVPADRTFGALRGASGAYRATTYRATRSGRAFSCETSANSKAQAADKDTDARSRSQPSGAAPGQAVPAPS